jgi:hypothetical protein
VYEETDMETVNRIEIEGSWCGFTIEAVLEYDWQHADSTLANGSLDISRDTDEEPDDLKAEAEELIQMLQGDDVRDEFAYAFGNKYVSLMVTEVNGEVLPRPSYQQGLDVIDAVVHRLKSHPGERLFLFNGTMG